MKKNEHKTDTTETPQTDRQTDKKTRQTDRQTDIYTEKTKQTRHQDKGKMEVEELANRKL